MKKQNLISSLRLFCDKLHFIVIALVLLAISLYLKIVFILLFIYLFYLFKRRLLNKASTILLIIFLILLVVLFFFYNKSPTYISGTIYVSEVKDSYFTFYLGLNKYMSYSKLDIKPGDILYIEASLNDFLGPSYSGDFNTLTFLRGKLIKNIYNIDSYEYKTYFLSFNRLRYLILAYYKPRLEEGYFDLFSCLVLGENNIKDLDSYARLNILHVLALSGFHLVIIYNILFKLIFCLTKKYTMSQNICLSLIFIYSLLCGFSISLRRALFSMLLKKANERLNLKYTKLDLYSLNFLILLINPLAIYNTGFIFSELSSFLLLYLNSFLKTKNKLLRQVLEGLLFLLVCLPFMTNMTNKLSIFSLLSFLFTNIISYIFIPLCFSFLIFPQLSHYLSFLLIGFSTNIKAVSNILVISLPYMNNYLKLIYYFVLIYLFYLLSMKKKMFKGGLILVLVIIINLVIPTLGRNYVIFLDCGQGDCCLIKNDNKYYMIDCYNSYDYLVKRGIKEIEGIFITHADSDHFGDVLEICSSLDVNTIYYAAYASEVKDSLAEVKVNTKALSFLTNLSLDNMNVKVLSGLKKYDNENDNSLVLEITFLGKTFLFTGDISETVEKDIIPYLHDIDILKVSHHGSDTSTSPSFLAKVKPEIAIISCGYKNRYNFPKAITLTNLKRYALIYLTYENGNITFYKDKIKTYR